LLKPFQQSETITWLYVEKEYSMIVEMRAYKTKPGKRSHFIEVFRSLRLV